MHSTAILQNATLLCSMLPPHCLPPPVRKTFAQQLVVPLFPKTLPEPRAHLPYKEISHIHRQTKQKQHIIRCRRTQEAESDHQNSRPALRQEEQQPPSVGESRSAQSERGQSFAMRRCGR